jgi:hypothetical protein
VLLECIAIVAAVVLFAVSVPLIYFASESKQYSSDVLVCLLLLLVIVYNFDRNLANRDAVLLAALGSVALWASYPALFILSGAGSTLAAHFILNRDRRSALKLGCVAGLWLVSLLPFIFHLFISAVCQQISFGLLERHFHAAATVARLAMVHEHLAKHRGLPHRFTN